MLSGFIFLVLLLGPNLGNYHWESKYKAKQYSAMQITVYEYQIVILSCVIQPDWTI